MTFNFKDFIEYSNKFKNMSNEFKSFLRKFMIKQSLILLAMAKEKTPVDTGLLRNSWTVGVNENVITIANDRDYASIIEYGTPARPNWKWAAGAHMMTISINELLKTIPESFDLAFQQFLREKGIL